MKMDRAMVFAVSLNTAVRIHDVLAAPRLLRCDGTADGFVVTGQLPLDGASAHCSFWIDPSWEKRPPMVTCHEPWVRTGDDWHVAPTYRVMCYIFRRQWSNLIHHVVEAKGALAVIDVAHPWIIRNCQWLLNKHLLAHQLGLDRWQDSWGYWPHGTEEADLEYERRLRRGRTTYGRKRKGAKALV